MDGATSYTLQVAADSEFDVPVFEVTTSDTSYALSVAERLPYLSAMYYWRVSTSNVDYPPSTYARMFSVSVTLPAAPVITNPHQDDYRLVTTLRSTITWDPVASATQYEVTFIDDYGVDYAPPVIVTDTQYTVPFNLKQTLFEVHVKSGNDDGWSDWSSSGAGIGLGDAPEMDSVVTTTNPTFAWEPVEGATSYTIQIDDNIEFNPPLIEFTTTETSHTLSPTESLPTAGIYYYWRVSASNVE